jgi:hypothetical protein
MVHPTCAPARHPNVPSEDDISALVLQVKAEISALSEVHRAVACVRNLLLQMQRSSAEERFASPAELNALAALVTAEFERRRRAAHAAITSMALPG